MKHFIFSLTLALTFGATLKAQDRFSDCEGAIILCDNKDLVINKLQGKGYEKSEVGFTSCTDFLQERNSAWIKFQTGSDGSIAFVIEPLASEDDIDFVVYKLDDEITGCSKKTEIRCMASGDLMGAPSEESFACKGRMGLLNNASDKEEPKGCSDLQDNFLSEITAQKGENYILFVNNYTSSNGFKVHWTGTASFTTPKEITYLPTVATQMSKAVFFQSNLNNSKFNNSEQSAALDMAFLAKVNKARAPNTFVGCLTTDRSSADSTSSKFTIGNLYPNPAQYQSAINITAPFSALGKIEMYDMLGRLQFTRDYVFEKGIQQVILDTEIYASGIYFVAFRINGAMETRKLMVTRF